MGVRTNAGGGASVAKLKTALVDADSRLGIDVQDSSYNEICDALADYFDLNGLLYDSGVSYVEFSTNGGWADSGVDLYSIGPSGQWAYYTKRTTSPVDVTQFSTVHFLIASTFYNGEVTLDVSALSGYYYIKFSTYNVTGSATYFWCGVSTSTSYHPEEGDVRQTDKGGTPKGLTVRVSKVWLD